MFIYYVNGEKFTKNTNNYNEIPWEYISSPDEQTPAFEDLLIGFKSWCNKEYTLHRLTGPAKIYFDGQEQFWLDGIYYSIIKEWIKNHPNPDLYFDAIGLNETERVLWFLQN